MLTTFLIILFVLVSLLMIGVILIQQSKGGGLAGATFGGQAEAIFGGANAGNILTKATTVLAIIYAVLCIAIAAGMRADQTGVSIVEKAVEDAAQTPAAAFPEAGSSMMQNTEEAVPPPAASAEETEAPAEE